MKPIRILLACLLISILVFTHSLYPKWKKGGSEAIISWDVFGYYLYLPAYFIYHDIEKLDFIDAINKKYAPAGQNFTLTQLPNGNKTGQYSLGWAVFYAPAFLMAHAWASLSNTYLADGFSLPYQFCIAAYGLIFSYLGLWLCFLNLRFYFKEIIAALAVLLILLSTNALEYLSITVAMTHAPLFFFYAFIIWLTIKWHKKKKNVNLYVMGFCLGLMCIMRPTEIVAVLIPILWGVWDKKSGVGKLHVLWEHKYSILISFLLFLLPVFFQMYYWKTTTGHYIFYSYGSQGFSWLHPHLSDVLYSYRKGWLIYTPFALLFIIGLVPLYKNHKEIFWAVFIFMVLNFYIISAWDIWWYGGSLGQRALVQSYAVCIFSLAAFLELLAQKKWLQWLAIPLIVLSTLHNWLFTYKAHGKAPFEAEAATSAFFKRTYFELKPNKEFYKLLDTDYIYEGKIRNATTFIPDSNWLYITGYNVFSDSVQITLPKEMPFKVARVYFTAESKQINSYYWNMPQFNVVQLNENNTLKTSFIRVHRFMNPNERTNLFIDIKLKQECTALKCYLSIPHGNGDLTASVDSVLLINNE